MQARTLAVLLLLPSGVSRESSANTTRVHTPCTDGTPSSHTYPRAGGRAKNYDSSAAHSQTLQEENDSFAKPTIPDMLSQESQKLHTAKSSTTKYEAWHTTCGQKTVWEIKCCLASEKAYLFPTVKVCTSHNIRHVNCNKTDASAHSRSPSFVAERGKSREFCKHNKGAHTLH